MPRPHLKPFAEQVMVVTGASSGIGRVTAIGAAKAGAKVMLVARDEAALRAVADEIAAAGGTAAWAVADVGDPVALARAADIAVRRLGPVDTWINNAGVAIYARLADTPLDEHRRLFDTNYFGMVNGCTEAVKLMRGRGGAIVTIGSLVSQLPTVVLGAYAASKHAAKGYVDSLRMEIAAEGLPIAVTLILPSGIDTPVAQHAANHLDGEALLPPPVYDPQLVADAILDAAVTVRREVTVGGIGRAQVLAGLHFPKLLEWAARPMAAALVDRGRAKTKRDALDGPGGGDRARSGVQAGRRFSVYAVATRHPLALGLGLAVMGGAALAARRRRA